jgi:hypothetical protein
MRPVLASLSQRPSVEAMTERATEFETPLAAKLAGIAIDPVATERFDRELDRCWAETTVPRTAPEIVVGGGLHAAIYCAVRAKMGYPKPLVIEATDRVGGALATSRSATFYLNSRNRPGGLGIPGRAESLNVLPGAVVQPADLSGDEYQPNSALAFSIRATLMMTAKVLVGRRVTACDSSSVTLDGGDVIKTTRVIRATGLGEPIVPASCDGVRMQHYEQFVASLDDPFPLRGLTSVAVVGAGDSGKTAVEALIGQGPAMGWTATSLDYVAKIDWYGVPESCLGAGNWESSNRSRYKGIGRELPRNGNGAGRINPISRRASAPAVGYDGAYVDGARYDRVIWATGYKPEEGIAELPTYEVGGRGVARMRESGVLYVGPAAQLAPANEQNLVAAEAVPENTAAVFRYADRTAALAMHLPSLDLPRAKPRPRRTEAAIRNDFPF